VKGANLVNLEGFEVISNGFLYCIISYYIMMDSIIGENPFPWVLEYFNFFPFKNYGVLMGF
jgi:hypothetical protein